MRSHIRETTSTYDRVASRYLEATRERGLDFDWLRSFAEALPKGSLVLDLGSGPGRDAADLRALGLCPICLDISRGMLRAGVVEYPAARVQADFRAIPIRNSAVKGVWANASLLHASKSEFSDSMAEVSRVLAPGGQLFLSVKKGDGAQWESERYGSARWFEYWNQTDLDREIATVGLKIQASSEVPTSTDTWLVRRCVSAA
jgi:ubiquinone/menaquinone biosynthesis C-methylase UbiE